MARMLERTPAFSHSMRCEDIASHPHFCRLSSIEKIAVDLRYAGMGNFVARNLYGTLDCAWLHQLAAEGLRRATHHLEAHAPGQRMLVLDALRPHRVQIELWDYLDGTGLRQYVADPALGSIHSFGMAVDVTLLGPDGQELDMGSGFDEMTELSHPRLEAHHLAQGALTAAQVQHRHWLRSAMEAGGFNSIDNEWWHFDMLERSHVRQHFVRVD